MTDRSQPRRAFQSGAGVSSTIAGFHPQGRQGHEGAGADADLRKGLVLSMRGSVPDSPMSTTRENLRKPDEDRGLCDLRFDAASEPGAKSAEPVEPARSGPGNGVRRTKARACVADDQAAKLRPVLWQVRGGARRGAAEVIDALALKARRPDHSRDFVPAGLETLELRPDLPWARSRVALIVLEDGVDLSARSPCRRIVRGFRLGASGLCRFRAFRRLQGLRRTRCRAELTGKESLAVESPELENV